MKVRCFGYSSIRLNFARLGGKTWKLRGKKTNATTNELGKTPAHNLG
jgi:hypothetical protein